MKKALLLITLFSAAGSAMAQVKFSNPKDGLLYPQFDYQKDTSWRTLPNLKDTLKSTSLNRFNTQTDLSHIFLPKSPIVSHEGYNMPIAVLNDVSNMPIKKIEGFYTMPVVGTNMTKPKKIIKANP